MQEQSSARVQSGTAMPPWIDYGLSQNDVGDLVNFIRSINPKTRSLHARAE